MRGTLHVVLSPSLHIFPVLHASVSTLRRFLCVSGGVDCRLETGVCGLSLLIGKTNSDIGTAQEVSLCRRRRCEVAIRVRCVICRISA